MARGERTFVMKFVGDAKQALGEMEKLVPGLKNMSRAGKAATGAALAGGVAIGGAAVAGFAKAISLAADYEKAIDAVGAVAGASEAQTRQLYETGRRLGKTTAFTATEAAAAMEELAAQGLSVDQIVGGAADATVALAAAGGVDLVTAATAAAQTMGVWGLKADAMTDVVNRMAGAANVSQFGVLDMTQAVSQGAGVAAAAGISYQDFLTTIAATSKSFSSGSDAGTGFKTFIQRLVPQSKEASKAMARLGIITAKGQNTFFDAKGNFLGMANAAGVLDKALSGLSDEARTDALKEIFGSDASRTAASLAEQGRAAFESMDKTMGGTDAAAIAAQRMSNFSGSLERLKGALEDIGITLGEKFLPPLTYAAELLAGWLSKVPGWAILAVGGLMLFIGALSALALFLLPAIALLGPLGLGGAAAALAPLIVAAFPYLLVVAAIVAIIAAGVLLMQHWDAVMAKAGELGRSVHEAVWGERAVDRFAVPTAGEAKNRALLDRAMPKGFSRNALGFGSGGIVPGPRGAPTLAMVHGGETILPTHRGGGYGGVTVNVMGNTMQSDSELQRIILGALHTAQQRGALGLT